MIVSMTRTAYVAATIASIAALSCVAALTLVLLAPGGAGGGPGSAGSGPRAGCPEGPLRLGVERSADPQEMGPAYQRFGDALASRLGCSVEVVVMGDEGEVAAALEDGRVELAQLEPLAFARLAGGGGSAPQRAPATPLAAFADASGESAAYSSGIWVARASGIRGLGDLAGRSLALGRPGSVGGDALPAAGLKDAGVGGRVSVDYAGDSARSMRALVDGTVDAAQIDTSVAEAAVRAGALDPERFRRIWTSQSVGFDLIAARSEMPRELRLRIAGALIGIDPADLARAGRIAGVEAPARMVRATADEYRALSRVAGTQASAAA